VIWQRWREASRAKSRYLYGSKLGLETIRLIFLLSTIRSKVSAYGSADDGERRSGDGCGSFRIREPVMMIAFMCFNQPETYGVFRDYTDSIGVVGFDNRYRKD
jgi:hypothetical protein